MIILSLYGGLFYSCRNTDQFYDFEIQLNSTRDPIFKIKKEKIRQN